MYPTTRQPPRRSSISLPGEAAALIDPTLSALWEGVDRVGVNESAGHFFGFIPGAGLHTGAVGDSLGAVTNRHTGVAYGAPGVVRLQQAVLAWIGGLLGYPSNAVGDLTSGGSIANRIATVAAREAAGLSSRNIPQAAVYLSSQTHRSISKALRLAGLAEASVRKVPTDARYRMDAAALEEQVNQDARSGLRPWLVVATALNAATHRRRVGVAVS